MVIKEFRELVVPKELLELDLELLDLFYMKLIFQDILIVILD